MVFKRTKSRRQERTKNFQLFSLALPAMAILFVFNYIPMAGIFIAFKDVNFRDGIFGSPWNGFENFEFFFKSSDAFTYTRNTLLYNLAIIVFGTLVSLVVAMMLNEMRSRRAVRTYQTFLFFPYFFSWVIVGYMSFSMFSYGGVVTNFLGQLGINITDFYTNTKYWPVFLVLTSIWKNTGYNSIIYYASIMGISSDYYEAADIDGATRLQKNLYITLPLLAPTIILMTILAIGNIFRADFGLYYYVPRDVGQLYPVTQVIDTAIYRMLKGGGDIGMTAAVGFFQSVVGFIMVFTTNLIVRKISPENSLF